MFNKLKKPTIPSNNSNSISVDNNNSSINTSDDKKESSSSGASGLINNLFRKSNSSQSPNNNNINSQPKPTILSQTTDVSSILNFQPIRDQYKLHFIDAIEFIKNEQNLINNLNLINSSTPPQSNSPVLSSVNSNSNNNNILSTPSNIQQNNNNNNNLISLIIDPKIIGLMNLIIDTTFLKTNGIDKIYELKSGKLETESKNIIYLIRPKVKYMNLISDHIRGHLYDFVKKNYSIIYIPKVDPVCTSILEEQGVHGNFSTITSMPMDLIPFDNDVLSMELPNSYTEFLYENNRSICYEIAKSIMKLQQLFGIIPMLKGKGKASKLVVEILNRLRTERQQQFEHQSRETGEPIQQFEVSKEIESITIVDRDLDLITPLCTPLTYEGLIDEYFSINNNILLVDSQILTDSINGKPNNVGTTSHSGSMYYSKKSSYPLHSGDKVFSEIRNLNFSNLIGPGGVLNSKARQQQTDDKKQLTGQESLSALRDLMKRVNASKQEEFCLQVHVGIAEKIHEITSSTYFQNRLDCEQKLLMGSDLYLAEKYILDCIAIKDPILKVLRLLSLYSLSSNGLNSMDYEMIKTKLISNYGIEWLINLSQLERIGLILIRKQDSKPIGNFQLVKEDLNLIVEDVSESNPSDFSYVYSGYAPLLIRLIQYSLPNSRIGWKSIDPILKLLPGPSFEENQLYFISNNNTNNSKRDSKDISSNGSGMTSSNSFQSISNLLNSQSSSPNSTINNSGGIPINIPNNNTNLVTIEKPIISFIFFVGGVTFSEISALRFLGKQTNRKFIILTTKLINGDSLIQTFLDPIG